MPPNNIYCDLKLLEHSLVKTSSSTEKKKKSNNTLLLSLFIFYFLEEVCLTLFVNITVAQLNLECFTHHYIPPP